MKDIDDRVMKTNNVNPVVKEDKEGNSLDDNVVSSVDEDAGRETNQRYKLRQDVKAPERLIETCSMAAVIEPNTYDEAMSSNECKEWKHAMDDEFNSLVKNNTWKLIKSPENQKIIVNRWVFKVKYNANGSVDRFKARLVIRGFTQQYGVDYEETFSPVVKFTSVRTILSIAAMNNMQMRQFDIKTAFLYGDLKEDVYMHQPVGYEDNSGRICKLVKSLYGLKQASRCWNQKFSSFIRDLDFKVCESDQCVFVRIKKDKSVIIAIYVDDGLIISNDINEINLVISYLKEYFEVKDFDAKCFLGFQIERSSQGSIHIHQEAYIKKILNRFNMTECMYTSRSQSKFV